MKKFVAVLSAAAMMTSLAACGYTADTANTAASSAETTASAAESTADTAAADSYKVAIVQQLDHASLDEIRVAIEKELDAKAAEKGITIEYKDFNGQNDATTLNQIGTEVVADGYDAIIPIATLAAQCMTTAAESTKTPVIYAAISDPAAADLTDIDYVTGTSDALNTQSIMDMMFAVQPDIQTVGLLYSNSEANSTTPIAEAKAYLDAKGIAYVEKTGNTNDEIMTAASSMVGQVDAVFATYTITDERKKLVSFAGPYYYTQQAILVLADNDDIKSVDDLTDKNVAVQSGSNGPAILEEFVPKASQQEFKTDEEARQALQQGRVDAYVIDNNMQQSALVREPGKYKIAAKPFGSKEPYGIGLPLDSDGVAFVNDFLKKIEDDGTWTELWQICIGDRTGDTNVPELPEIGA